jgi:riboflavin synthase
MFTGLIEKTGTLLSIKEQNESASLSIQCSGWDEPLVDGESIAVQGACLTVTSSSSETFTADLLKETLARTTFAVMKIGAVLNLERALRHSGRLGGHIVTGHIDGTGNIKSISHEGRDWILTLKCAPELLREIVVKGSVALNGVSLTVTQFNSDCFSVNIIPFTWEHTNFSHLKTGDAVNIETDIIGKYVNKYQSDLSRSEITVETLVKAGFISD